MWEFKAALRASAERTDRQLAELSVEMGELANKMGTRVEDIVFPGLVPVCKQLFPDQGEPERAIRMKRKHHTDPGHMREFDSLIVSEGVVLVVETKRPG